MTPLVILSIGGAVAGNVGKRAMSGEITEHDGEKADELRLTVSNFDGRLAKPARGTVVTVEVGFEETGIVKVGQFTITEVVKRGALAVFEITGHSADLKKTLKQQKARSWVKGKTLGDVVRQVAGDNGLSPAIAGELAAVKIDKIIAQVNESDMHLLTRLARHYGALFKVAEGKLLFVKKGSGQTAGGGAAASATVTPNDLEHDFQIADKDRPARGKIKAHHYDRATAKRKTIESGAGGGGGAGDAPDFTFPQTFATEIEAQKAVDARKKDLQRKEKSFSGTFRTGFFGVAPGGVLASSGFGDDDDCAWTVKRRVFDFGGKGLVTRSEAEVKK